MTETTAQTMDRLFNINSASIGENVLEIVKRAAMWFQIIQPEKTYADFVREFIDPLTQGADLPVKLILDKYVPSSHTGLVIQGHLMMVLECIIFCLEAAKADDAGDTTAAWCHIGNAMFRLGRLEGLGTLDPAITHVVKARSTKGAATRNAKFAPIRERARELAAPHQARETKRKTALLIKKAVLAFAEEKGVEMSEYEAERTIIKWLDGLQFATK